MNNSVDDRITSLEFSVAQINDRLDIYLPFVAELQKIPGISEKLTDLSEKYSKIRSTCTAETTRNETVHRTINDLVEKFNSIQTTQTTISKDVVKLVTEVERIKKDLDKVNTYIDNIAASGWRIIERFAPTIGIIVLIIIQYMKSTGKSP
jgi:chromosome segregation ATPase